MCLQALSDHEQSTERLADDPASSNFRTEVYKATRSLVNRVSRVWDQIGVVTTDFRDLLSQQWTNRGEEKTRYVELKVAKVFAEHIEDLRITDLRHFAWPAAYVARDIFKEFPTVEKLFYGHLRRSCRSMRLDISSDDLLLPQVKAVVECSWRMLLAAAALRPNPDLLWEWVEDAVARAPKAIAVASIYECLTMAGSAMDRSDPPRLKSFVSSLESSYIPRAVREQPAVKDHAQVQSHYVTLLKSWCSTYKKDGFAKQQEQAIITAHRESRLNPRI